MVYNGFSPLVISCCPMEMKTTNLKAEEISYRGWVEQE